MRARSWIPAALATAALVVTLLAQPNATPSSPTALLPAAGIAADGELRVTAVGDIAAGSNSRAVLDRIGAMGSDLTLVLGDLSYGATGAEQEWCDLVTARVGAGYPFQLVAGNHESNGQNGHINDFSACLPNQLPGLVGTYGRQWYVDVPASDPLVRFVMISPALPFPDGTWSYAAGTARYAWTAAAIDGARTAGVPWVVVGMHKPCLSVGTYGCEIGADLHDMLLAKKVDLVLSGHEHSYFRSHQVATGTGCTAVVPGTFDADCVEDADGTFTKAAGTVLATVGTGGIEQRPVNPADTEAGYFAAMSGLDTATWGVLDLRLTATTLTAAFDRASGGTFTDSFTIGPPVDPPPNQPPTAAFTSSCNGLTCAFDSSGSSDTDGLLATRAWTFGDGQIGSGTTPSHTYSEPGTYTVGLTVTDDDGATASTTASVEVTDVVVVQPFAADAFTRTRTSGFGTADVGGAWRTTGSLANYSVDGSAGRILLPTAGSGPDISLPSASSAGSDLVVVLETDKRMTGSGLYVNVIPRRTSGGHYSGRVILRSDGQVALGIERKSGTTTTQLAPASIVPGLAHVAGQPLTVRVQAVGTSPTTIQAKVWTTGTAEPSAWHVVRTDSTTALQGPGWTAINHYLSSSTTNAPITVRIDTYTARPAP